VPRVCDMNEVYHIEESRGGVTANSIRVLLYKNESYSCNSLLKSPNDLSR